MTLNPKDDAALASCEAHVTTPLDPTGCGVPSRQEDAPVPLFDTARIHVESAAEFALAE